MNLFSQVWTREAVGYRQGELEGGDGVATMVVTLIGGPALLIGSELVTGRGLALGQILLVAPVAALLGAAVIGSSATMASQTGANSTWLLRPAFGIFGSRIISLFRLAMIAAWAVIGLQLAGSWVGSAATEVGMGGIGALIPLLLVGLLGLGMTAMGLVPAIKTLIRKPIFIASVFLVAVLAWRLMETAGGVAFGGEGSFWGGLQLAAEMAVVFVPFVESVARRLHDEEEAMSAFGVGYAVPATLMVVAGSILAFSLGGVSDLTGLGAATAGAAVAAAWVLIAEIDQVFSAFTAAGSEAVGVIPSLAPTVVGLAVSVGIVAAAVALPPVSISVAALLTAIVFPAVLISVSDFNFTRDRYYTEADIYGGGGIEGFMNVPGIVLWVIAVLVGQMLDPVGPDAWMDMIPELGPDWDIPWRLVAAVVAAATYVLFTRWHSRRATSVYDLRGV
jgi:purine-cytosine permease-like protein